MREIEVKLRVKDHVDLEKRLAERGCVLGEAIDQRDVIYFNPSSDEEYVHAKKGDLIIRLRYMDHVTEFTMKQCGTHELDNIELETIVEKPEIIHRMLGKLGYEPIVEVKKIRRHGKIDGYTICLDEVEKLGTFVELEKLTEDEEADPVQIGEELFAKCEELGLSRADEEKRGYDTQMYLLKK